MNRKNTQAEVRRRDNEIAADEKEIQDLRDTPPGMLDDLERLKLMRAVGKRESFEDRMRRAPVELRKRMLNKGGFVRAADGIAKRGKTKGKML